MNIRTRLSVSFLVVVAANLILFSLAIYFTSAYYRQKDFYTRLVDKARSTARMLSHAVELDARMLRLIDRHNLTALPEEQITVYNRQNQVVYASDDTPDELEATPEVLNQIRQEKEVRFEHDSKEIIGVAYTNQGQELVVIASGYDEYGFAELRHLRTIVSIGLLISLTLVGLTGWFYAGRALRPISDVISQVDSITVSNLNQRVTAGNDHDEIAKLAETFNRLLSRIQTAFDMQRTFVANASHELRTPLTIITGQIEVTLIKPRTVEEHEAKWRTVLDAIRQINRLANDLLQLAQVSVDEVAMAWQEVALDEAIYQAAKMLRDKQPDYQVLFSFDESMETEQPSLIVKGEESLLISAFLNLMENACKFSANQQVEVVLGIDREWATIRFTDRGIGISEKDMPYIYVPFFRAENARQVKGYGIGLPLTRRIVLLHHGFIEVESELNMGTTITVRLPTTTA
ncbi:HAMP domain-containing sensor histidine kinase [Nibrella viscosa]|uniref:histidine kinase n=1 Tax=Nibrella viscosa TaxID=1084524 RepID=A0ABP8K5L5_9BACT